MRFTIIPVRNTRRNFSTPYADVRRCRYSFCRRTFSTSFHRPAARLIKPHLQKFFILRGLVSFPKIGIIENCNSFVTRFLPGEECTMVDHFGREITYLRISVTELCNLRCRYCMPEDGICKKSHEDMLTEDEIITAVRAAASLGISKLRITGGEPLVKKNIVSICRRAAAVPGIRELCLTTNGTLLPELAVPLHEAGVRRVNISLDTLDREKFHFISRTGDLDLAIAGIRAALDAGFEKIKLNTVLIGGFNDDEIPVLAELTRRYPVDLRFIELMPMYDSGDFGPEAFIPYTVVLDKLPELQPEAPDGGVARLYRLPDALGSIGLISPVSAHFCATCNRIRLTADGKLKPCLHSGDEYSLKGLDYDGMVKELRLAIEHKPSWHGALDHANRSRAGRNMNQIGG